MLIINFKQICLGCTLEWMARSLQTQKFFFTLFIYISLIRQIKLSYPSLLLIISRKHFLLFFNLVIHVLNMFYTYYPTFLENIDKHSSKNISFCHFMEINMN